MTGNNCSNKLWLRIQIVICLLFDKYAFWLNQMPRFYSLICLLICQVFLLIESPRSLKLGPAIGGAGGAISSMFASGWEGSGVYVGEEATACWPIDGRLPRTRLGQHTPIFLKQLRISLRLVFFNLMKIYLCTYIEIVNLFHEL